MDQATAFFEPLCYIVDGRQVYVPAPPVPVQQPTVPDDDPLADSDFDALIELYNKKLEHAAKLVD